MTNEVFEHLCEAYLVGTLYETDFISLLKIKKKDKARFTMDFRDFYDGRFERQRRIKEENSLRGYDYIEGGQEFAKYLNDLGRGVLK